MLRTLFCVGALAVCVLPCRAGEGSPGSETVIRLTVEPAPAPSPALRYRLLPELQEMEPGNPLHGYFRALLAHQKFLVDDETSGRRERLLTMPLKALPAEEMKDYGRIVLDQVDRAARLDRLDWQILPKLRTDGFSLLLPDVQVLRSLANALKVRFRAEVALRQFDDAIRTAKSLLALSRHLGEHPSIIGNLVGVAIAFTAIEPLEEMLQQPGCPNLYWALTTLPSPLISMAIGMEGERTMLLTELRELDDTAPMDAERIKKFGVRWDSALGDGKKVQKWLDARTGDEGIVGAARRRLVESGLPEGRLLRFPAEQVLLLDEKRECLVRYDDVMKTMTLPGWQIEPQGTPSATTRASSLFVDDVLKWTTSARRAQGRLAQRIALLRHVEALRLHAAEHGGKLPATLSEISVPLPDDPFTGKPFPYELRDRTAHLRGTPPPGAETTPGFTVRFEVTLQE